MDKKFLFDIFLLYHPKDRRIVLNIAQKLQLDGQRVWFADWEIKPDDNVQAKIEEGLGQSRVLALCVSENAYGSEWTQLESYAARFGDQSQKEQRLVILRVDWRSLKESLRRFPNFRWYHDPQGSYEKLLDICRYLPRKKKTAKKESQVQIKKQAFSLGHTDTIRSVAFSPDGKLALSGSHDRTVRIWDVRTGECIMVLEGHSSQVACVAWSPDQLFAVSGSLDSTIRLWDIHTGQCLQVMKGHFGSVMCVSFSPDGLYVLSASLDKAIRIWDTGSGKCLHKWKEHAEGVVSIAWSPDGKYILSGSHDHTVVLWDAHTGQCLQIMYGHTEVVRSLCWHADGKHALSGSRDQTVRLWDVHTGICLQVMTGHTYQVLSVSFHEDGIHALSASGDHTWRLWNAFSGEWLSTVQAPIDITGEVSFRHNHALVAGQEHTVELWNVTTGRCIRKMKGHNSFVSNTAWSSDGAFSISCADSPDLYFWDTNTGQCLRIFKKHTKGVISVALSHDGRHALSGSADNTMRLWETGSGKCLRVMKTKDKGIRVVALSANGLHAISGFYDYTIGLWNVRTGKCLRIMEGHLARIYCVAFSADGVYALSASEDHTIRLWKTATGECLSILKGHTDSVLNAAFSPDGIHVLSSSGDNTIRLWEVESAQCLRIMEGHTKNVLCIAWSPDGIYALSGSADNTIRLWETATGRCLQILEGHSDAIINVRWNKKTPYAYSAASNGVARKWDLTNIITQYGQQADLNTPAQVQYCNAKVLLVGDSGVGKTGLSKYLAHNIRDTGKNMSTDGAWATQWTIPHDLNAQGVDREIWLWDFAGQVDYRLVHQLFMDNTAAAVLVFNPQQENPFEGLGYWDRDLNKSTRTPFARLLAAGRIDRGGLIPGKSAMENFMQERKFRSLHLTSAKTGEGCEELREAIIQAIDWQHIPTTTSPVLYHHMKQEILKLRDDGMILTRLSELQQKLEQALPHEPFTLDELKAVIRLLDGPGMIQQLVFGEIILLQPEILSRYAAAVVRKVRQHPQELGCISEEDMLAGKLDYQDFKRLAGEEEKIVLRALHEKLVTRAWCLRQPADGVMLLIFPSYFRRERPEPIHRPDIAVTYRFSGPVDEIYATLVVRLHHTMAFETKQLWKDAADFTTQTVSELGFRLIREAEGAARLEIYFTEEVANDMRLIFLRYVHNHLNEHGNDVKRLRTYYCTNSKCLRAFTDHALIEEALTPENNGIVYCPKCSRKISLRDDIEQKFDSSEIREKTHQEEEISQSKLDNESLELILEGHAQLIVGEAGQIYRAFPKDHGLDAEIEFKDDRGQATGKRLYLQLKSGISHLTNRQSDEAEIFRIKKERWATYWQQQAYPVMLVIRKSKNDIRWMEVSEYLKQETADNDSPITQILFTGELFDVASVQRWRSRMLELK